MPKRSLAKLQSFAPAPTKQRKLPKKTNSTTESLGDTNSPAEGDPVVEGTRSDISAGEESFNGDTVSAEDSLNEDSLSDIASTTNEQEDDEQDDEESADCLNQENFSVNEDSGNEDENEEADGFESLEEDLDISGISDVSDEEPEKEGSVFLKAREFKEIMETACTSRDGSEIKQLVALAKSLMRSLLSSQAASEGTKKTAYKSGKNSTPVQSQKAQELKIKSSKIESMKRTTPFSFDEEIGEVGDHLFRISTALEENFDAQNTKIRATLNPLLKSLWSDAIVFLKNRGSRDPVGRRMFEGVGVCLWHSLFTQPQMVLPLYHRFVEVALKSSPSESNCLGKLKDFFCVAGERLQNAKIHKSTKKKSHCHYLSSSPKVLGKIVLVCLRRLLNLFGQSGGARMSQRALENQRVTALVVAEIIENLQVKGNHKLVFETIRTNLEKIETALTTDANSKKQKKLQKRKGFYKAEYEIKSWRLLFDLFVTILLMKNDVADPKYAMVNHKDAVFKILTLVMRRYCCRFTFLPLILKCMSLVLLLSRILKTFQPIGILLLKIGFEMNREETKTMRKLHKEGKLVKPVDIRGILIISNEEITCLKVSANNIAHIVFQLRESMCDLYIHQVTEYCCLLARHPAFAEQSVILSCNLRKIAKLIEESSSRGRLKQLIEAIEKTARQVQNERAKLKLSEVPSTLFVFNDTQFSKFPLATIQKRSKNLEFWDIAPVAS
eukprot:Gregarina_sp_Poly_1__403@NODE_109_length_14014_cov_141_998351_g96_i0_p3_GENE_NODE_109_length_14014_cov_141_998351_g96_i0NODE_109_length_14014_cov_141_998351_g96_i0_p3_ORF_typecomplete_len724_score124_36Noc2/PF03715_13/4_9e14DUF2089/PF09862_9/67DUF2089/PF09862_9/0_48PHM7_cyt/PF14703_6/1_6e03PHM7_cyt/PF14703_6/1_5_NODE_109_length_14014_cov_141_998351_g96_i024584629